MAKTKSTAPANNDITVSEKFKSFFVEELKDINSAEKHLPKASPRMQKADTSEDLAKAFADHLAVTNKQIARLEQIFLCWAKSCSKKV